MIQYLPLIYSFLISLGLAGTYLLINNYLTKEQKMNISAFLHALETVAPVVLSLVPGVPPILIPVIQHGIAEAEKIPGASGAQKKAAVIDLVNTSIATANSVAGKQVVDPTVVNAISNGIDTTVGVINTIHKAPVAPDADIAVPPTPPVGA